MRETGLEIVPEVWEHEGLHAPRLSVLAVLPVMSQPSDPRPTPIIVMAIAAALMAAWLVIWSAWHEPTKGTGPRVIRSDARVLVW